MRVIAVRHNADPVVCDIPHSFAMVLLESLSSFIIMAALAQWLPVFLIPEQLRIASMRDNMIDYGCRFHPTFGEALNAERIAPKKLHPGLPPLTIVPARSSPAT